jgi:prepilin-type N-terminal cleavage/methylation domain-containing protein
VNCPAPGGKLSRNASHEQHGFTLIEMIVALALVALISIAIFESLRFGQRTYKKVINDGGAAWEVFAGQRLIRTILESAYPQEPSTTGVAGMHGVEGDRESVAITAAAPLAAGGTGLMRYEISVHRAATGASDMVVRWWPQSAGGATGGMSVAPMQEVVVEKIASAEWSYQSQSAQDVTEAGNSRWQDNWRGTQSLPALVRLRVTFDPQDSRRWPDLIVAPKVSDDANCVFDVVAQRCRGTS